jgi:23S rRNA (pseudouridine1915-N3)-methyltransferase
MKILIAAVGKLKDGPERELVARYAERAAQTGRAVALGPVDIREIPESRAKRPEDRKREESAQLALLLAPAAPILALDETGKTFSSVEFAEKLGRWRDDGAPAVQFVIGGADGLDAELVKRAALVIGFGRMTWPHQIVRVLLAEQIYRAATILAGHPYHRE